MALTSPGVEVKVIDESFYTPAAAGTVPMIFVATASNKTSSSGAGIGAGLGLGLLSGMLGGQGGTGGYTPPDFEDYQFRKTYQAPELLELAPQYEGYQSPAAYDSTSNYAQSVADQIRNLTSFPALSKDQVQNSLGLFQDSLLQEAVMQNLYGAGGR